MYATLQFSTNTSERRTHGRQKVLLSCVKLGDDNGGILLNISLGGLALQAAEELIDEELATIRFQLSQSETWIEAKGRIAWRGDSKRTAGVEFIDLPEEALKQILNWISLTSDASGFEEKPASLQKTGGVTGAINVPEPINASRLPKARIVDLLSENRSQDPIPRPIHPFGEKEHVATGFGKTLRMVGLSLGTLLCLSAFIFLSSYWQVSRNSQSDRESKMEPKAEPQVPELSATSSGTTFNPRASLEVPSFMLQVGAMVHEENANALAESLRQRHFPASVSRRGTNRFFLVVVGPYDNADTAATVKSELEQQGFKAFRTEWKLPSRFVDIGARERTANSVR